MKPYPAHLRESIVNAVKYDKQTPEQAALRFGVARATAYNYLQLNQDLNDLTPLKSTGRKRKIATEQEFLLQAQILEYPNDTLEQHCQRWQVLMGVQISITGMHNSLVRLGVILKKDGVRRYR